MDRNQSPHRIGSIVLLASMFSLVGVSIATAFGLFGYVHWTLGLFTHFPVQYLAVAILLIPLACFFNRPIPWLTLALLVASVNLWTIWPFLWQREVSEAALDPGIEIMLWNTWRKNDNWTEIENYIRHTDGDIVILQETEESVRSKLRNLDDLYVPVMHHDNVVLLSHSLRNASAKPYPLASGHAVEIRLDFDGSDFAILTTHLPTPTSSSNVSNRRLQLAALRAWASQQHSGHLLIGDFNMTPWSFEYRELIEDTGLNDSMVGFGIQTTWPFHDFLTSLFRIPLDHCLTSAGLAIGKRATAESGSSNHRPLHVRIHRAVKLDV